MKKALISSVAALAVSATTLAAAPAQASQQAERAGTTSLAEVLASDGSKFDKNWKDFDILEAAVTAVLANDKKSPVAVLADGKTKLTAFAPTDKAFKLLAQDLSGKKFSSEKKVTTWLAKNAGIDTIETVLLYHVVAGKTLDSSKVVAADGAAIKTAQGGTVTVKVSGSGKNTSVTLVDQDPDSKDPKVIALDINKGNRQIAHGIDRVLRPLDL
ncbi:fasciclin domain-containing protein [Nocardioides currus]|uniref:Fasciclin n=1 Tax=Nocardioides currus TaxID=2133958 RepID=A0A2R7YZG7_9ACTN|nr:fasciclin domain-containing protein [Nocardioides currus]PUA81763.1 fasciclin [Nocardioides currus]